MGVWVCVYVREQKCVANSSYIVYNSVQLQTNRVNKLHSFLAKIRMPRVKS